MPMLSRKKNPVALTNIEYDTFDRLMGNLLKVPHSELKTKLEEEKERKGRKIKTFSAAPVSSEGD